MRTIGVLGGIGPQATIAFEQAIHRAAQRLLPPKNNEGYPPLVSVYMRHPPVDVIDGKPTDPLTLDPRVLDAARRLGEWAELIAIPSNTPHLFVDQIAAAAGCEIVSIADVTLDAVHARDERPVGLLGLGVPKVYSTRFAAEGLEFVTAPDRLRTRLDDAILRLMEGREGDTEREDARAALAAVRDAGARVTVLGCSEIPLLLGPHAAARDLIDPAALLAEAVVRRAIDG